MNREPRTRAVHFVVAACVAAAALASGTAEAQCASANCNTLTHHWGGIGYTDSSEGKTAIGMWEAFPNQYYPTMCFWNSELSKWILAGVHQTSPAPYSAPQLTNDTSVCLGGGDDEIQRFTTPTQCWLSAPGGSIVVEPFDNNGHDFKISGGSGNDVIDMASTFAVTGGALCGGGGNDRVIGGFDYQYVSGGHGHDWIWGAWDTDNVRGHDGGDVLFHTVMDGVDLLRGENDVDCMRISTGAQYDPASSCGSGDDRYQSPGASPPASCGTSTSNCCSVSDAC